MRGSVLFQFNLPKITEFYKKNGIRINTTLERLTDLNKEFFQYDGEMLKMGEDKKPLLLPDKKMEDFDRQLKEIMEKEINIIL